MKTNKALKRLAKIEALVSDVTRRFSAGAPHVSGMLKDLKAAVARVKEAVSTQTPAGTAKKKSAPGAKKAAAKRTVVKARTGKTAKKKVRIKRSVKKTAGKRTAPASATAQGAVQETTPAIDTLPENELH